MRKKFTEHEKQFIQDYAGADKGHREIAMEFNTQFDSNVTPKQIKSALSRYSVSTGRTGRFEKNATPHNKKKTGTLRVNEKNTVEIKSDDGKWDALHRILYKKYHGNIPAGHIVIFANSNKRDFRLENLLAVSHAEYIIMKRRRLLSHQKDATKAALLVAKLRLKIIDHDKGARM